MALVGMAPLLSGCFGSVRQYGQPIEQPLRGTRDTRTMASQSLRRSEHVLWKKLCIPTAVLWRSEQVLWQKMWISIGLVVAC